MTDNPNRSASTVRPVLLCILDGWGERSEIENNAIAQARTPVWDRLAATCPHGQIQASSLDVGLPTGQMGNSEVGHMNIGAGRVVMQELPRIDQACQDGSLAASPELATFVNVLKASGGACHLMGLLSPGGVHSHQNHMVTLVRALGAAGVPVILHAFMDGRDTPPSSGKGFLETFLADVADVAGFSTGTVSGRFFAMDRDKRWDRVEQAYRAIVSGQGETAADALAAMDAASARGETDEFVAPTVVGGYAGMKDGDGLLMANFRADRARELLTALADEAFDGFERAQTITFAARLGMVAYSSALAPLFPALFPPTRLSGILGEVVAEAGLKQLRIAETEKYAHVTFFLNGGREQVYDGEERLLVPSPKVKTYDLQPEMSAPEVTDKLVAALEGGTFDLIVVNFANGDMVGHTGILEAAVKAAETLDASLGRLENAIKAAGGVMLVTADHGNLEQMADPATGEAHTAHTVNPVPLIAVGAPDGVIGVDDGRLADIAPTVLALMGLKQPVEMTGRNLLRGKSDYWIAAE
ncbi:MAG: 2,3-bisphosphoglycerate-independent phosphoglycerate mutase [Rhodospirillales bacterium]